MIVVEWQRRFNVIRKTRTRSNCMLLHINAHVIILVIDGSVCTAVAVGVGLVLDKALPCLL
jgi:hypothetical protein